MQNTRSLRAVLLIALAVNASFASLFSFSPALVERLYGFPLTDSMHFYFSAQHGAMFFVLAILALLALLRPQGFRLLSLVLLLQFLALLITDVVLLARGLMTLKVLLPEMVYCALMSAALIRFVPLTAPKPVLQVQPKKEEGITSESR